MPTVSAIERKRSAKPTDKFILCKTLETRIALSAFFIYNEVADNDMGGTKHESLLCRDQEELRLRLYASAHEG